MFPVTKETIKFERIMVLPETEFVSKPRWIVVVMTVPLIPVKVVQIQRNNDLVCWVVMELRGSLEMVTERHRKNVKGQFGKNVS
jgi:hypothetical protein